MSEANGLMTVDDWTTPDPRRYTVLSVQGRKVRIRSLHAGDVADIQAPNFRTDGKVNLDKAKDTKHRSIIASVVNENNEPFLTFKHCEALRAKDAAFIQELYDGIAEFSGLEKDEGAEKNSVPTTAGSSPSG